MTQADFREPGEPKNEQNDAVGNDQGTEASDRNTEVMSDAERDATGSDED